MSSSVFAAPCSALVTLCSARTTVCAAMDTLFSLRSTTCSKRVLLSFKRSKPLSIWESPSPKWKVPSLKPITPSLILVALSFRRLMLSPRLVMPIFSLVTSSSKEALLPLVSERRLISSSRRSAPALILPICSFTCATCSSIRDALWVSPAVLWSIAAALLSMRAVLSFPFSFSS